MRRRSKFEVKKVFSKVFSLSLHFRKIIDLFGPKIKDQGLSFFLKFPFKKLGFLSQSASVSFFKTPIIGVQLKDVKGTVANDALRFVVHLFTTFLYDTF